jgi:hypothetical protein
MAHRRAAKSASVDTIESIDREVVVEVKIQER